jgi:hypothetical protein
MAGPIFHIYQEVVTGAGTTQGDTYHGIWRSDHYCSSQFQTDMWWMHNITLTSLNIINTSTLSEGPRVIVSWDDLATQEYPMSCLWPVAVLDHPLYSADMGPCVMTSFQKWRNPYMAKDSGCEKRLNMQYSSLYNRCCQWTTAAARDLGHGGGDILTVHNQTNINYLSCTTVLPVLV